MLNPSPIVREATDDGFVLAAPSGNALLSVAVDSLRQGLLVLDATGHVLSANAAARRIVARRPEVALLASPEPPHDRVRLRLQRGTMQLRLERALKSIAGDASGSAAPRVDGRVGTARSGHALMLAVEQGQPTLVLQLSPMTLEPAPGRERRAALGVLVDRSHALALDTALLRDLFGLTEAEARVAEAYLRVDTVKDVAALLGVSVNTVKTHMAAAYLKTGCTRQAQLVRLLMTLAEMGETATD